MQPPLSLRGFRETQALSLTEYQIAKDKQSTRCAARRRVNSLVQLQGVSGQRIK